MEATPNRDSPASLTPAPKSVTDIKGGAATKGLMRKARSLDCFHRDDRIRSSLFSSSARRRKGLLKTPEGKVIERVVSCGEDRSGCGPARAAASRFSRSANPAYRAVPKPPSSGSPEDLAAASENHLSVTVPVEDEGSVPAMLTTTGIFSLGRSRLLNVAILSLLGLVTAADLARRGVVTGSRIGWAGDASAEFYYDDLSTEGIVPPFRYAPPYRNLVAEKTGKPKMGLGSAMIGSVTSVLSPVLPFAGGMDLRRGEAWGLDDDGTAGASGWVRGVLDRIWGYPNSSSGAWTWSSWSISSPSSRVLPADMVTGIPRGGGGQSKSSRKSKGHALNHRELILSATEPFLPTTAIAELTLGDVTTAFRYAVESGRDGFNRKDFLKQGGENGEPVSYRLEETLNAMDSATARSRGAGIEPARTASTSKSFDQGIEENEPLSPQVGYGDIDALQFCAAMRLFAEWRIIRQVPEGYKGYAVGMGLGHKDVVQNVVKIENAVHDLLRIQDEDMAQKWDDTSCSNTNDPEGEAPVCPDPMANESQMELRSPTLRDLLQYELSHGVQNPLKLPRLKEKSAAMGLLWVRRQLQYQTVIFSNMLDLGSIFPSAIDAVRSAYSEVYDKFHGWAVQKIFNYSFQAAPDAEIIYKHMNPRRLAEVTALAQSGKVEHVGEVRYESTETTESETITMVSSEGEEERISDTTVTRATTLEESWDDETASSRSEDIIHTHSGANVGNDAALMEGVNHSQESPSDEPASSVENRNELNKTATSIPFGAGSNEEPNPLAKFGLHVASEWDKLVNHIGGECDKFGKHIGTEWDKFASNVVRVFQKDEDDLLPRGTDVRGGASPDVSRRGWLSGDGLEAYITRQMADDAHSHINRYLRIVRPLLLDLAGLFDEMNMDDPTKV